MTDWAAAKRVLWAHRCQCGSGGAMACDEDCPGDTRDPAVTEVLIDLITAVDRLEQELAATQRDVLPIRRLGPRGN